MPLDQVKALASAHPDSFAAQMALGAGAGAVESRRGDCGVREGRAS